MGLFSTATYLGMAALPFIAGIIADSTGFFYAFCATALFALTVFLTIDRCECQTAQDPLGTLRKKQYIHLRSREISS